LIGVGGGRMLDVPWWVGLLFGLLVLGVSVGGVALERRSGVTPRSHLVLAGLGGVFGALLVVDALV
jgi:hypothetical protein